jgi:hypothetical protein
MFPPVIQVLPQVKKHYNPFSYSNTSIKGQQQQAVQDNLKAAGTREEAALAGAHP